MASHNFPSWLDDIPATALALCKVNGIVPATLPRSYFFGPDPAPVIIAPAVAPPSDLTDLEWSALRPFFPSGDRKNAAPVRLYLNGALYQRSTRCRFCHIPKRYGSVQALRKRLEDWAARGNFATLLEALTTGGLDELAPERKASLLSLCRDWSARGVKYAAARNRNA
jgi:hypothetical protein